MFAAFGIGLAADRNTKPRSKSSRSGGHNILKKRILIDKELRSLCPCQFIIARGKIELAAFDFPAIAYVMSNMKICLRKR